ncbi:glycosyltransferase family 4 protein [Nonomuraea fuscirosea]|uniref:glycosyltransferase family 4 protein n=1 Tax=Nonomuraea fuscirosea TaxID=1291556 RepID=UPI0033DFB4A5
MSRVLTVFGGYPNSETTGGLRMAWRTAAALVRRGHEVAVLTDSARPPGSFDDLPVRFRTREQLGASPDWRRPDVVHVYDLASAEYAALGYELARESGAEFLLTPASAPGTWPDHRLGRRLCGAARAVFTLTPSEAALLADFGVPASRIRHIPQAPDLIGAGDGAAFLDRHSVTGPLVLFLGRRIPSKGYHLLLEAAPLIWRALPETVLAFGGPSGGRADQSVFARHRDERILDLGLLDESGKHDALAACDLLCLPSCADVFPLVFAEAWSCGKPVVSGRFAGVEDVVRADVDGLVCDLTAGDVAAAVLRLLHSEDLRTDLGAAGLTRIRDGMNWPHVAAVVENAFPGARDGRAQRGER